MYNKLFSSILDSSIWVTPSSTKIVWITLLASMDEDGYAHYSTVQNLANRACVSVTEAQAAIDCFMSPDPQSGDPAHDGRRVERIPGGFIILNATKYRDMYNRERNKELNRMRVAKFRAKNRVITSSLQNHTGRYSHEYEYEELPKVTKGTPQKQTTDSEQPSPLADVRDLLDERLRQGAEPSKATPTPKAKISPPQARETKKKAIPEPTEDQLNAIYNAYPRKTARITALTAIKKALKTVPFETLLSAVQRYARTRIGQDPQYTPLPSTWFNGGRWDDELPPAANGRPDFSKAKVPQLLSGEGPELEFGDSGRVITYDADGNALYDGKRRAER